MKKTALLFVLVLAILAMVGCATASRSNNKQYEQYERAMVAQETALVAQQTQLAEQSKLLKEQKQAEETRATELEEQQRELAEQAKLLEEQKLAKEATAQPLEAVGEKKIPTGNLVDHWQKKEECLKATSSPLYFPSKTHEQKLEKNEVVQGLPGGCYKMDLPDRENRVGWVRLEDGRPGVFNKTTGQPLRLEACNNVLHEYVLFPDPKEGPKGDRGLSGINGINGVNGLNGLNGLNGINGINGLNTGHRWHCGTGCKWGLAIGIPVAVGTIMYLLRDKDDSRGEKPGGKTGDPHSPPEHFDSSSMFRGAGRRANASVSISFRF